MDGRSDLFRSRLDLPPLVCVEDDNREPAILQVLLIAKILVGRDHDLEAIRLSYPEQFAVRQFRPALLIRSRNCMTGQHLPQSMRHILIEQNLHGLAATAWTRVAKLSSSLI